MICERAYKVDIRSYKSGPPIERYFHEGLPIEVVSTSCHFGGKRWWFRCPGCGRRCAILYPTLCRLCSGGRYAVELQSPHDRLITKAIRLRRRLGQAAGGTLVPLPLKPKHMHWSTYDRLVAQIEEIEARVWVNEARWLEKNSGSSKGCSDPVVLDGRPTGSHDRSSEGT